jgi:hypothetical protein
MCVVFLACKDYKDEIAALEDKLLQLEEQARQKEEDDRRKDAQNYDKLEELEDEIARLNAVSDSLRDDEIANREEVSALKETISNLQSVLALNIAYYAGKWILTVDEMETEDGIKYYDVVFDDSSYVFLPSIVVSSLLFNEETGEYVISLYNDQRLVFNTPVDTTVYPASISLLTTRNITFFKSSEVTFRFIINPADAEFNYDVTSPECDVAIQPTGGSVTTYASANAQAWRLTKIVPSVDENDVVIAGQFVATIQDLGGNRTYKDAVSIAVRTHDAFGQAATLSSPVFSIERKQDTGLPVVQIRTASEWQITDKTDWLQAVMTIHGLGEFDNYEGQITVRGRGNSTWFYHPKKPYNIKLDSKSKLLGMPSHKRWSLLANYKDRTMLRNHLAFEIARHTGLDWAPHGYHVELIINDVFVGNYYLCEQIKVDKNRVNIVEMTAESLDEESITGGYLMEVDSNYDEVNKFRTQLTDYPFMFQSPDEDVLQPAQFEYLRNYIDTLEAHLYNADSLAKRTYTAFLDVPSFIDWWLVYEIMYNKEPNGTNSCYMHKDVNGKLKAGPVWDFDNSFTNKSSDGFAIRNALWYTQLFKDPEFVKETKERWRRFRPDLETLTEFIETEGMKLSSSDVLNKAIWGEIIDGSPLYDAKLSFTDAISQMKTNYTARLAKLNTLIEALH